MSLESTYFDLQAVFHTQFQDTYDKEDQRETDQIT